MKLKSAPIPKCDLSVNSFESTKIKMDSYIPEYMNWTCFVPDTLFSRDADSCGNEGLLWVAFHSPCRRAELFLPRIACMLPHFKERSDSAGMDGYTWRGHC